MSLRFQFELELESLQYHFDSTSIYSEFTSVSLRVYVDFTPVSLKFDIDVTSMSLRFHFGFVFQFARLKGQRSVAQGKTESSARPRGKGTRSAGSCEIEFH